MSVDDLWIDQKDDIFNTVADIDPPSTQIEYAYKAGYQAAAAERDAARREVERLTHQNQRLIGALRVTATVAILARCPVCLAERTNGERHDEDCPLLPHQ